LATVATAVSATAALLAPAGVHRLLFRRHARLSLVTIAHRCALVGLTMLGLAMCGVVDVITAVGPNSREHCQRVITAVLDFSVWVVLPIATQQRQPTL
jgi:hypothetical protein